jgi:hypothetical protein
MQQTESTTKYVLTWNDQALDTYHDIVISFTYAMYNYNDTPTCGFCVSLFESLNEKPRGGGPFYSLGYTPSDINDVCNPQGYSGLESALYGIGFDVNGIFAKKTNKVNGVLSTIENSICLRNGIRSDYSFIKQSENLLYSDNFTLAQQLTSLDEKIIYKQIRVIFKNALSKLEIEAKEESEKEFKNIFQHEFAVMPPTSVKVGLFFTSLDQDTKFELKNFNVAGFPSRYEKTKLFSSCSQILSTNKNLMGNKLPAYNEWIVASNPKGFQIYKSNSESYIFKQNVISTSQFKVLNYNDNYIFIKANNNLLIYEYSGNSFIKQFTLRLPENLDISSCAGYGDTLVMASTSNETFYVYKYDPNAFDLENIGNWFLYQTFAHDISGYGNVVEMNENYIIASSKDDIVTSFIKDPNFGYLFHQNIFKPNSNAITFGRTISLDNRDLLIGAPYAQKSSYQNFGNGEVYHYYLSELDKKWTLIMEMGDFFKIDSPAGNFGNSLKIRDNIAIVGAPSESYYLSGAAEEPNVGRAYVFRKTPYGYFTQSGVLAPLSGNVKSYTFFGSQVNTFQNLAIVGVPFTLDLSKGQISIFNIDCVFTTPPLHLPIPVNAIQLLNLEGFVIDREEEDYMVVFKHPNPSILYTLSLSTVSNQSLTASAPFNISLSGIDINVYGVDNWYWSASGKNIDRTTQNATFTYPNSGSYTIKLSATNIYGMGVETIYLNLTS